MYRQTNGALLREVYPPVGPCSKAPPPPTRCWALYIGPRLANSTHTLNRPTAPTEPSAVGHDRQARFAPPLPGAAVSSMPQRVSRHAGGNSAAAALRPPRDSAQANQPRSVVSACPRWATPRPTSA